MKFRYVELGECFGVKCGCEDGAGSGWYGLKTCGNTGNGLEWSDHEVEM